MLIYSIFDSKVGAFMSPFLARTDGEAIRMVAASLFTPNGAPSMVAQYPEDFVLFALGEWDDSAGIVSDKNYAQRNVMPLAEVKYLFGAPKPVVPEDGDNKENE